MFAPTSVFWAAFWLGLAGPVSLYEATPDYPLYVNSTSVALNFAVVGMYLDHGVGGYLNVGEPSAGESAGHA
jgi:hypothetical protein